MRRLAGRMLFVGGVVLLVLPPRVIRAQEPAASSTPMPTVGRFWLTADASAALGWTNHRHFYRTWSYPDGAIGAGMRVTPHVAMRADLRIVPMSTWEPQLRAYNPPVPLGYSSPPAPEHLGTIRSASVGASWISTAPDGAPRFVWSLSPGVYDVADVGSASPRRRAFGLAAGVEQAMARGDHVLLTLQVGATVLPNVNRDVLWYAPIGLALRFW